jgi:hypothetical protein
MFISKKKLAKYIKQIKDSNRAENLGQKYDFGTLSEQQIRTNIYAQGYEDGTDNFCNAVCAKFKIKRD